eukprot:1009073-Rhodomonas_salina.1
MHDYCGCTHARMDGVLGGPSRGDGGVGRADVIPDVERDLDASDWFPDSPEGKDRVERARSPPGV